jgi:hypothetical protein
MQAVSLLNSLGYTNVRHYPGGLSEWNSSVGGDSSRALATVRQPGVSARATGERRRPLSWSLGFIEALADQSVGRLFGLWFEIVGICGVAYWLLDWLPGQALVSNGTATLPNTAGFLSALYFSAVTATSVGYGDIVPVGATRLLAIVESISGLIIFGCLISKFVSRRQEELIAEIHWIAFEDRLGRVRTNLHLVRTELQATARLCEGHELAPPVAIARVESIAMVFVGELHAVHDLLYRPQRPPEEAMLEAILASLASVFREFNELLRCVEAGRADRPPALRTSLSAMARLAGEICGDCVPRQYAPALRAWMDQIQRAAAEVIA